MPKRLGYADNPHGGRKSKVRKSKGRRSKKKGRMSKSHVRKMKKAKKRARQNIARMMGETPTVTENKFKSERNKRVSKPKFKKRNK